MSSLVSEKRNEPSLQCEVGYDDYDGAANDDMLLSLVILLV